MNRRIVTAVTALAVASVGLAGIATNADALGAACKGDAVKPRVHSEVQRRLTTLGTLVTKLSSRTDPYGVNAQQISTLQSASSGLTSLDQQIQSTCYADAASFRADVAKVFTGYRVYWLRLPQTDVVAAADRLAAAQGRLEKVSQRLAGVVGTNSKAQADLAAMHQALQIATSKLGAPPSLAPNLAAVPPLQPAPDMTAADAALRQAHTDLVGARDALQAARAAGERVLTDLHS